MALDLADLNPAFSPRVDALSAALDKAGIGHRIVSGYRSPEYQNQMYQNHLARAAGQPLPYPNAEAPDVVAPAWRSFHNYGLAVDFILDNPADYARLAAIAPQFGVTGIGATDKGHIQMTGSLAQNIDQFKLANWRPASQPAPAEGAIAYTGGPPAGQPPPTLAARGKVGGPGFLDAVAQIESGNRLVYSGVDKDYPGQPNSRSQGYWQIDTPTWQTFAAKAGIDTKLYPNAMSAPRDVQAQVASLIPLSRFGARTQNMLGQRFGTLDKTKTLGELASTVPGSTLNTTGQPAGASGTPAGGQGAPAGAEQPAGAQGGLAGSLPGFAANSPGAKMTASGLQGLFGGQGQGQGGGGEQPKFLEAGNVASQPMVSGPGMMIGAGGQNTFGQRAAEQAMAQRGFLTGPSLAANVNNPIRSPVASTLSSTVAPMSIGSATGMGVGLPGTTLNSPSQLQMAMMTGNISPYDIYAGIGGGAQFGSS